MAKTKTLILTRFSTQLIRNCADLIERFLEAEKKITIGHKTELIVKQSTVQASPPSGITSRGTTASPSQSNPTGISDLLVLVHATIIQEWLIFLDYVFGEAVRYCLMNNLTSRLPSMSFGIRKLAPNGLVNMRESICLALIDVFSFNRNYPEKIKTLNKIFNVQQDVKLEEAMKKHVTVRNIFQHHRGEVRPRDIDTIGKQYFEILDDAGNPQPYRVKDTIVLTKREIESLNDTLKIYSNKFEVLT